MSNTTRQNILNQLKTTLEKVTALQQVEINRTIPIDLDTTPFPCAFIYSVRETKLSDDRSVIGYENWEWLLNIEVWLDSRNDQEILLGEIHHELASDNQIGGYAVTSDRIGSIMYVVEPDRSISAMILEYSVIYRHKNRTP